MNRRKTFALVALSVVAVLFILGSVVYERTLHFKAMVDEVFELNSKRKSEGFYTAEFEFKVLGIAYLFDRGRYFETFKKFNDLYIQLKTADGMFKVPDFAGPDEEAEFYLSLQDPETGAFMDPSYPLPTYLEPTANVINHLDSLAKARGRRLELRYPLRFLEQIDEPDELRAYMDDLSTVGLLVSKLPETPYIFSSLDSYHELEAHGLFRFSEPWKRALLKILWDTQDSETGYWGARLRGSGELVNGGDVNVTRKNIKELRDGNGGDRHQDFPLRYTDKIIAKALEDMRTETSGGLSDQHGWSINQYQTARLLFDYLWKDANPAQRQRAAERVLDVMATIFAEFYVPSEGAFSLYANAASADLDGTYTYVGFLQILGYFSADRSQALWGLPEQTIRETRTIRVADVSEGDLRSPDLAAEVSSVRFYAAQPEGRGYASEAVGVYELRAGTLPDALKLTQSLQHWVDTTPLSMGNWASRGGLRTRLESNDPVASDIGDGTAALAVANAILKRQGRLLAIGFDRLQVPRQRTIYLLDEGED